MSVIVESAGGRLALQLVNAARCGLDIIGIAFGSYCIYVIVNRPLFHTNLYVLIIAELIIGE